MGRAPALHAGASTSHVAELIDLAPFDVAVNHGLDKVRSPTSLQVGSRVRGRLVLNGVDRQDDGASLFVDPHF